MQFISLLLSICSSAQKLRRLVVKVEGRKWCGGERLQWVEILFLFLGGKIIWVGECNHVVAVKMVRLFGGKKKDQQI